MTSATSKCPACGGSVHPLAGRCKHCKVDLAGTREREAAVHREWRRAGSDSGAAPAPLFDPPSGPTQPSSPGAPPPTTGPPPAGAYAPPPAAPAHAPYPYASSWSRRWPLAVAGIALLAIGISLGILIERSRQSNDEPTPIRARDGDSPEPTYDFMPDPGRP